MVKRQREAQPKSRGSEKFRLQKEKLAMRFRETIPSTLEALEHVVRSLMVVAREMNCGDAEMHQVELALREALTNAIVHGNREDPSKKVVVNCFCQPERGMLLVIEDEGSGFDPRKVPDPRHAECLFQTHGRGLFLMRRTMDRVRISRAGRRVTLVKRLRR